MKKEIQVVMLPTEKATNVLLTGRNDLIHVTKDFGFTETIDRFQHLYFLSDEEIKEGDWILSGVNSDSLKPRQVTSQALIDDLFPWEKKIIATTDESLGLPRPSNEFLQKYCELGGVNAVLGEIAPDNTINVEFK